MAIIYWERLFLRNEFISYNKILLEKLSSFNEYYLSLEECLIVIDKIKVKDILNTIDSFAYSIATFEGIIGIYNNYIYELRSFFDQSEENIDILSRNLDTISKTKTKIYYNIPPENKFVELMYKFRYVTFEKNYTDKLDKIGDYFKILFEIYEYFELSKEKPNEEILKINLTNLSRNVLKYMLSEIDNIPISIYKKWQKNTNIDESLWLNLRYFAMLVQYGCRDYFYDINGKIMEERGIKQFSTSVSADARFQIKEFLFLQGIDRINIVNELLFNKELHLDLKNLMNYLKTLKRKINMMENVNIINLRIKKMMAAEIILLYLRTFLKL